MLNQKVIDLNQHRQKKQKEKEAAKKKVLLNELSEEAYKLFSIPRGDKGTQHDS